MKSESTASFELWVDKNYLPSRMNQVLFVIAHSRGAADYGPYALDTAVAAS